jgi:hypothetical protein
MASGNAYTEDQLVERPAIGLFDELGRLAVWYFAPHSKWKGHQC